MPLDNESIIDAIKKAKEGSKKRGFLQSIELLTNLRDIDTKKPENRIVERIELPHAGKDNKICVIASGEMALKARRAKADSVLQEGDVKALMGDKKRRKNLANKYDFFIAEAPLMPLVGRILGATLGPKGKMPTAVPPNANIEETIEKHRRTVLLRMRGQPVVHCRVGNEDMSDEKIAENVQTVLRRLEAKLRKGIKNISSIHLKTTMGSPVEVRN